MGLEWSESKRRWEWDGSIEGLVAAVGNGDARLGFVVDKKTGAKLSMNIDGGDVEEGDEPFYIESPNGDNLYDAYNRAEAIKILGNIRRGSKNPDIDEPKPKRTTKKRTAKRTARASVSRSIGGVRH